MKKTPFILILVCILLLVGLSAFGVTSEHTTTNGLVAISNATSTAEWKPQAVFLLFSGVQDGTVTVYRTTRGVAVPLARHAFTNTEYVTWLPAADYPVRPGDVLTVTSSVPAFTLQIERGVFP